MYLENLVSLESGYMGLITSLVWRSRVRSEAGGQRTSEWGRVVYTSALQSDGFVNCSEESKEQEGVYIDILFSPSRVSL